MEQDFDVEAMIEDALFDDEIEEFEHLLRENPQYLLIDGHDKWMRLSASEGNLRAVQILVDLGIGVNQPHCAPDDNLHLPDGPIVAAATKGHLDVVRWLLDHGAELNCIFKGHKRCMALKAAATQGHLDVVKLLVERGADIHATNGGMGINAITQAALFGNWDVYDFLYSLGGRDWRDTTPPNYPEAHENLIAHMVERCGPLGKWRRTLNVDPSITILSIPANEKIDMHVLFTVGLSDRRLPSGRDPFFSTELRWMMPASWTITDEAFADSARNWVFDGIERIISESLTASRWPEKPVIFPNGDPPQSIAPGSKMCAWLCLEWLGEGVEPPDHRVILIHSVFPIFAEEVAFAREQGQDELVNRFNAMKLPLSMTLARRNAVTDWIG